MKYDVKRTDGKDNKDEVYIVIRVDLGAKDVHRNRKAVKKFAGILKGSDKGSSVKASREITKFIKELTANEVKCPQCKGEGEFEQSAGSHSYFVDCDGCNGKGIVKK